jgi:hypothetical protein
MRQEAYIAITAIAGGIAFAMFVLPLFFAQAFLPMISSVIWAPVVLGVVGMYFSYKSK